MNRATEQSPADALAARMIALDFAAFEEFAALFGPRIRAYLLRRGMPISEAEDLAVSCVTDIAMQASRFEDRGPGSFERWAFRTVYRRFVDWYRKRRLLATRLPEGWDPTDSEDEVEANPEVFQAVDEALAQLPQVDRRIIALRDLEQQFKYDEIGDVVHLTEGAVRVRHYRALKRLEQLLARHPAVRSYLNLDSGQMKD